MGREDLEYHFGVLKFPNECMVAGYVRKLCSGRVFLVCNTLHSLSDAQCTAVTAEGGQCGWRGRGDAWIVQGFTGEGLASIGKQGMLL